MNTKIITSTILRTVPRPVLQRFAHLVLPVVGRFHKGDDVECNICSAHYAKFFTYGRLKPRENALCPNCLSLERHRLMWLFLQERTDFFTANLKVLHIAPEYCFIDRFKKLENLDYNTGDLVSPLADFRFDVHDIPFDEASFDVVFCNHVMEHVDDDHKAMSEIHRVLRPGGWAIIQSPQDTSRDTTYEDPEITSPLEREKAFWQSDHVRLYGLDYGKRLENAGFDVKEDLIVQEFASEQDNRHALPLDEIVYLCNKKA